MACWSDNAPEAEVFVQVIKSNLSTPPPMVSSRQQEGARPVYRASAQAPSVASLDRGKEDVLALRSLMPEVGDIDSQELKARFCATGRTEARYYRARRLAELESNRVGRKLMLSFKAGKIVLPFDPL
jgi:hypothetical protein